MGVWLIPGTREKGTGMDHKQLYLDPALVLLAEKAKACRFNLV